MNKSASNLLFLAVGAAIGAAVGYVAASDKKPNDWLREINGLVDKVKDNVASATHKGKGRIVNVPVEDDAE